MRKPPCSSGGGRRVADSLHESFDDVDGLRNELGALSQRWQDRLVLERTLPLKAYLESRINIAIYLDLAPKSNWVNSTSGSDANQAVSHNHAVLCFESIDADMG